MADEDLSVVPGPEAAPQDQQTANEPTDLDTTAEAAPGEEGETIELEDYEHDGKLYPVPKPLLRHLMRDKDYSEKSAANARDREALEARYSDIEARSKATDDWLDLKADLRTVTKQSEAYKDYTFAAYQQHYRTDPMAAGEAWAYKQDLIAQRADLEAKISAHEQERSEKAQNDIVSRFRDAAIAAEKIPGWTPQRGTQVMEFLRSKGVNDAYVRDNMSPTFLEIANLALIGHQTLNKPAAKPATPPPPELKTVNARTPPNRQVLRDDMPNEEWVKVREAQLKRRA